MLDTAGYFEPYRIKPSCRINPFYVRPFPLWKRTIDIIGSVSGLVLLSPIFLMIGLLIRIVSPGPVIFRQNRIGAGGQCFEFYKFRTMHQNVDTTEHQQYLAELIKAGEGKENDKPMVKLEKESGMVPFGRLLRKSYMDELPQLVNVLKGDMSLVGPRPPIGYEVAEYYRWHNGRFDCRPGMTGLWQVEGKNRLSFKQMVRLDIQYARNMSLWLDFRILIKTPCTILMEFKKSLSQKTS